MRRWLLFLFIAGILLLVVSAAGDVLFVHHHLDSFTAGEHYASFLLASLDDSSAGISRCCYVSASAGCLACQSFVPDSRGMARYFCGWNSSAYDREIALIALFNEPRTLHGLGLII